MRALTVAWEAGDRLAGRVSGDAARQRAGLARRDHRPYPPPGGAWVMGQTWEHVLFAHWPVPVQALAAVVPPALPVDAFAGQAWLGVVPFGIRGLRARGAVPLPGLSSFPELNVRTYVTVDGRPGIWFFTLEAASPAAVAAARATYRLPYHLARMGIAEREGWIAYASRRRRAAFAGRYRPSGPVFEATPGTLEHFLCERYCLYTVDGAGRVHRAEIHHPAWPLQRAEARIGGMRLPPLRPDGEPHLLYARRQDVVVWPLRALD